MKNRLGISFLLFLISSLFSLTSIFQAEASQHYVNLPAYTQAVRDLVRSENPMTAQKILIQAGPEEHPVSFLADREILSRIDFFSTLLGSGFKESRSPIIKISDSVVSVQEMIHLLDLAYLNQIIVSPSGEARKKDFEGLLSLAFSDHIQAMDREADPAGAHQLLEDFTARFLSSSASEDASRSSTNTSTASQASARGSGGALSSISGLAFASGAGSHVGASARSQATSLQKMILEWAESSVFEPTYDDLYFLSTLILKAFDRETLKALPPSERAWYFPKRCAILTKISHLGLLKDLDEAEDQQLVAHVKAFGKDKNLKSNLIRRLSGLPHPHMTKKSIFLFLNYDDFEC